MNKEQVYDQQVFPLMQQIIEICKAHRIAMVAHFEIPTPDDPALRCTTSLLSDAFEPSRPTVAAFHLVRHGFVALTMKPAR